MQKETALTPGEIFNPSLDLEAVIEKVGRVGYGQVEDAVSAKACNELRIEARPLNYEPAEPLENSVFHDSARGRVLYEQAVFPVSSPELPMSARLTVAALRKLIKAVSNSRPVLDQWLPNRIEYQHFRDDNDHIAQRQDPTNYQLLTANLTLYGHGIIRVGRREPDFDFASGVYQPMITEERDLKVRAGSLLLLKAAGLGESHPVAYRVSTAAHNERLALDITMRSPINQMPTQED
jgi:hypothetical protein